MLRAGLCVYVGVVLCYAVMCLAVWLRVLCVLCVVCRVCRVCRVWLLRALPSLRKGALAQLHQLIVPVTGTGYHGLHLLGLI